MRIPRLFQKQTLSIHDYVELDTATSHRLTTVLRLTVGAQLILFNGDGYEYRSVIKTQKKHNLGVTILEKHPKNIESPLVIHLGQVISKGEKMDFVIQKATELGVHTITPLFSERSVIHLKSERLEKKFEHYQKIAIHAAEQCGRTTVPRIEKSLPCAEWIFSRQEAARLILDPSATHTLSTLTLKSPIALLIGPEGGLTDTEVTYALQHGFTALRLGPRILRTETAALTAIAALQAKAGDLDL